MYRTIFSGWRLLLLEIRLALERRGAVPLGADVVSIMPTVAWHWDSKTPRVTVGGWYPGAALRVGGRVAVFGEAAMFSVQPVGLERTLMRMNSAVAGQNHDFLLTVFHWLSGLMDSGTKIASGTSGVADILSATFELSSTQERSTFECSIDGSVFSRCTSPKDYTDLGDGFHTFRVPAERTGTRDTTTLTITSTRSPM